MKLESPSQGRFHGVHLPKSFFLYQGSQLYAQQDLNEFRQFGNGQHPEVSDNAAERFNANRLNQLAFAVAFSLLPHRPDTQISKNGNSQNLPSIKELAETMSRFSGLHEEFFLEFCKRAGFPNAQNLAAFLTDMSDPQNDWFSSKESLKDEEAEGLVRKHLVALDSASFDPDMEVIIVRGNWEKAKDLQEWRNTLQWEQERRQILFDTWNFTKGHDDYHAVGAAIDIAEGIAANVLREREEIGPVIQTDDNEKKQKRVVVRGRGTSNGNENIVWDIGRHAGWLTIQGFTPQDKFPDGDPNIFLIELSKKGAFAMGPTEIKRYEIEPTIGNLVKVVKKAFVIYIPKAKESAPPRRGLQLPWIFGKIGKLHTS